jgi:Zn-dependent M28 family amino/carboxypeptidase
MNQQDLKQRCFTQRRKTANARALKELKSPSNLISLRETLTSLNIPLVNFLLVLNLSVISLYAQTKMTSLINEDALRSHTKFLSDDLLEGRGPGTRGGELAAKYIAAQFESIGLKGAGKNGSFYQPVSLVGVKADQSTKLNISNREYKELSFKFGDDFVAFTGAQKSDVPVSAEMIFVGYGIDAPKERWNDYKGSPDDFRNKILVMLVNDPPATTDEPNLFQGRTLTYYGRWTYKYEEAARRGAAGALLIHTDESAGYPWSVVRTSNGSWRFDIARSESDTTPYLKMRSWITDKAARQLMLLGGLDLDKLRKQAESRDFKPVNLNLKASINIKSEIKQLESSNVAALFPGSDPKLKDQFVIFTAHWDHLGIGIPNAKGDNIYNGAVDNATGVASMIVIANALLKLPEKEKPRRSIIFLITTAEEQGLLGAEWYAKHPLVALDKTVANVNLDSMNILGRTKDFVPLGAERSSLREIVEEVAKERSLKVIPDPRPEQGLFYRSDHFPLAKVGIPAISLKAGSDFEDRPPGWGDEQFKVYNTAHYHQPSDEYNETWDFSGMIQQTELALAIGLKAANVDQPPKYNENDEFAKAVHSSVELK